MAGDSDALVFTAPDGSPLLNSYFWRRGWRPAVAAAGLPPKLRVHDMRHTCVALLIAQGAHAKAIQVHLGHATITTTLDRYGHLLPDEIEHLAARLDSAYRDARDSQTDSRRTLRGLNVVELESGG